MDIDILSLFPEYFVGPFDESMIKRAREKGIISIRHIPLRPFGVGKHKRVDERPYGGGPGMVLKPEPITQALESVRRKESHVVLLSPQGKLLSAQKCMDLSRHSHLILLAGHYEGIDERVSRQVDEEISIGDFVLTNGALAAIVLVDAVVRLIPGVLGNDEGAQNDSFQNGIFEGPQYTTPEDFKGVKVPEVLLQGDHKKIADWKRNVAIQKTKQNRPDLWIHYLADHDHERNMGL